MKNIKVFCCVVIISTLFIKSGFGDYAKRTAPDGSPTAKALPPIPTKPLPTPLFIKPLPQKPSQPKPLPTPPSASSSQRKESATVQRASPVAPPKSSFLQKSVTLPEANPFDSPYTKEELEGAAKDTDNPFTAATKQTEEANPDMPALRRATQADFTRTAAEKAKTKANTPVKQTRISPARQLPATPIQVKALKDAGYSEKEIEEIQKGRFNSPDGSGRPFGVKDALELAEATKAAEAAKHLQPKQPTTLERVKQSFSTFKTNVLGIKPTATKKSEIKIEAPTGFRHTSTSIRLDEATKILQDANKQKAEEAKLQKQGTRIVAQISDLTKAPGTLTSAQTRKIKSSVLSFANSIKTKFATANGLMRATISKQINSIARSIDHAIAKLPVNSQQRKEMLSTKFALNHIALQTAKEAFDSAKTTAEKLDAAAEYSSALKKMANSPESRKVGVAEIMAKIKATKKAIASEKDPQAKLRLAATTGTLRKQLKSIQTVEATKKEHDALTKELIDGAIRDSATTTDTEKQAELLDAIKKAKEELR
jgi:hypothetical protein